MTPPDIPAGIAIERAAYGAAWSPKDYSYELQKNQLAYYFVLRVFRAQDPATENRLLPEPVSILIGLCGFWLIADEAHLSTIAIHPAWQRLGLGEWLLLALLENSQHLGAEKATLEVRPSNQRAWLLYQKYRFKEVGRRPHYYNNGEDALILTSSLLTLPDYQAFLYQRRATLIQRLATIEIDKIGQTN